MRSWRRSGSDEEGRPSMLLGIVVAALAVALTTAVIDVLAEVAAVESLGVAYLVAVLLVATVWGGPLGYATALASVAAFNWFHLPPTGGFALSDGESWVALAVLLVAALVAGSLADSARARAQEAEQRRAEAALGAEMAHSLLRSGRLAETLPVVSARLAEALKLPSAAIELGASAADAGSVAFALREDGRQTGTLLVSATTPSARLARIEQRVVPSLEALLAAALEREELLASAVETAALRRSDVLKTALLRAVSHDLRSPLTAILTARAALASPSLSAAERDELLDGIGTEATRLSQLVDKLLDLSRLEARTAAPQPEWCSLPEVIEAAIEHLGLPDGTFRLTLDKDLPLMRADAAQLERAFANLLENASRYSGGHPVSVRARDVGGRVHVRVVDRGPGVDPGALERIFEPFYRAGAEQTGHRGSGLGLAIVRGFVEVNKGRVWAESVPGLGTTFVVELPVNPVAAPDGAAAASAPAGVRR